MANIMRYRPLSAALVGGSRPFEAFDRAFDRMFDDAFGFNRANNGATRSNVAANLYETAEAYWVEMPVPGVRAENLEVTVHETQLTIKAKREWQTPENAKTVWNGFGQGEWQHSFTLPGDVNAEKVVATLDHGLLRLELPKAEHTRPRTIRVNAGGTNSNGNVVVESESKGE